MKHAQLYETVSHPKFPGQRELNILSAEHVKLLASPVKQLVYFAFTPYEPRSAADVAREIGKSAQSVRFHTNELLEHDLLLEVGTRKRRSRTESLYVWKGMATLDQGTDVDEEYNRHRTRGMHLETKKMVRETELYYRLIQKDPSLTSYGMWRKGHLRLAKADAQELRERLALLVQEFRNRNCEQPDEGAMVNVVVFMRPTQHQAKLFAEERGIDLGSEHGPEPE